MYKMQKGIFVWIFAGLLMMSFLEVSATEICSFCECENLNVPQNTTHFIKVLDVKCSNVTLPRQGFTIQKNSNEVWISLNWANLTHANTKRYINFMNQSNVKLLSFDNNDIQMLSHWMFNTLSKLVELSLYNNNISVIEEESFNGLENLENLSLSKNSLTQLNLETFLLPSLKRLNISFNQITEIVPFNKTSLHLTDLDISHNLLTQFPQSEILPKLEKLNASNNNILYISDNFFRSLPNLTFIDLSYNRLLTMEYFTNCHLPNLWSIDIKNNLITNISLPIATKLRSINLSSNNITSIKPISVLNSLEEIILSNNVLETLDPISVMESVKMLDVSYNMIKILPSDLPNSLEILNCSSNLIEEINTLNLTKAGSLHILDISHTSTLSKIHPYGFKGIFINSGGKLLLSHCSISVLHADSFQGAFLTEIDLSSNKLITVPKTLLPWDSVEINLQYNPLRCTCSELWMLDTIVPNLFKRNQGLLNNLRCDEPESIRGKRLVHWHSHSKEKSFCGLESSADTQIITMKSSPEMLIIFSILGVLAVILTVVAIFLQRKRLMKLRRINRRFK